MKYKKLYITLVLIFVMSGTTVFAQVNSSDVFSQIKYNPTFNLNQDFQLMNVDKITDDVESLKDHKIKTDLIRRFWIGFGSALLVWFVVDLIAYSIIFSAASTYRYIYRY